MHTRAENIHKRIKKLLDKIHKRIPESSEVKGNSENFIIEIRQLQDNISHTIHSLNHYGTQSHFVNLPVALNEAQLLLRDIQHMETHSNAVDHSHKTANELLNFWTNMSSILSNQIEETAHLKNDAINTRNRLNSAIENADKAFYFIAQAHPLHNKNREQYEKLLQQQRNLLELRDNIFEIFNTSIIPQTDLVFELIADNHGKFTQDSVSLQLLKDSVHDINEECAKELAAMKKELIPKVKSHVDDLTHRANEYSKIFQNTKNGAEVALLASTAHKNISEAIEAARVAALDTRAAVAKSQQELYPKNGKSVIEKGLKSLKQSHKIREQAIKELEKLGGN